MSCEEELSHPLLFLTFHFLRMPLLYGSITGGKVLAILFFLCIAFAGLSSLISIIERPIHVLVDFGGRWVDLSVYSLTHFFSSVRRIPATIIVSTIMFLLGTGSALDVQVLVNQDTVWAYSLIVSGCFLLFLCIRYGPFKFRRDLYTNYGIGDWPLPIVWIFVIV